MNIIATSSSSSSSQLLQSNACAARAHAVTTTRCSTTTRITDCMPLHVVTVTTFVMLVALLICTPCDSTSGRKMRAAATAGDDELCDARGIPMLMPPNQTVLQCTHDMDCLPPASCSTRSRVCCVQPLDQAPPPVGCPKGTRQLQNVNGEWVSCEPTRPSSCPGGALCYEDSLDGQHRCCGKDPGEGCGTGQRVLRHASNGSVQLCVPGALPECAGNAVCEWSFTIDRFQCCEPDSGCPAGEVPMFDKRGEVLTCSPQEHHHQQNSRPACPPGAQCRFNFWIADYQCCGAVHQQQQLQAIKNTPNKIRAPSPVNSGTMPTSKLPSAQKFLSNNKCAPGEIAHIELGTASFTHCDHDMDCPQAFRCHNTQQICCGPPGQCPRDAEHPLRDEHGNVVLCLLTRPEVCPDESKCRETVNAISGAPTGQRVCCGMLTSYECTVADGTPFPSREYPQICELDNPVECPQDTICQASNMPGVSICCSGAEEDSEEQQQRALCPKGWNAPDQLNIFCHPTIRGSCPSSAACLLSPVSQQFVCCEPGATTDDNDNEDLLRHHLRHGRRHRARHRDHGRQSARSVSMRSLSCPSPDDRIELVGNGNPRHCTIDGRVPCGDGFICEQSMENPRIGVCCSAQRTPNRLIFQQAQQRQLPPVSRGRADSYGGDYSDNDDYGNNRGGGERPSPSSSPLLELPAPRRTPSSSSSSRSSNRDEPTYRCPSGSQVPVLRNGQNVFCDLGAQRCPSGSSCVSALNAFGMMICCRNARQSLPLCPVGMQPEPSAIGYVPCDLLAPGQCSEGYQCVHSRDDPEMNICCSRLRNQPPSAAAAPICPNQQILLRDGSSPRYCSPRQGISACPNGYQCDESIGQPNVFVCCSIPSLAMCPQGFVSSLDVRTQSPIRCSPMDVSMCPAEAQCLQATNRASEFLCCESTEPGRVCPVPGQAALLKPNGRPEECTGPGSPCSKSSYTCQLSNVLNRYVCCGTPAAVVLCADGRETYQQEPGRVVQCNPITWPSECPAGYECALSNRPDVHVCCRRMTVPPNPNVPLPNTDLPPPLQTEQPIESITFRPPVDELTCPVGWSAYEDQRGAHHFCQDALDMTCPHGFSCAQSSVSGIFMCCRLASTIQCPHEYSTLMVNNNPRLCSLTVMRRSTTAGSGQSSATTANTLHACPTGYTCMQSSVPAVYVCCGGAGLAGATGAGTGYGGSSGSGYGSSNGGYGSGTGGAVFPPAPPLVPALPPGTSGLITTNQMGQPYCMDGQMPAYLGQLVRYCVMLGQASECPPSYTCAMSNRPGLYVCCHPFPVNRRASKAQQMRDYSKTNTTNYGIISAATARRHCPDNREPYRNPETGELRSCGTAAALHDDVNSVKHGLCPPSFVCKRDVQWRKPATKGEEAPRVCCSPIAFCPDARLPQVDPRTRHAKRCLSADVKVSPTAGTVKRHHHYHGYSDNDYGNCTTPYTCQPSTVSGIFVCCKVPPMTGI
ncbi:hypothetical protein niasHS_001975 [Heterodera schachtii]|uniref:Uncharacterized protein n=1 Tax=Heterodera schachtii TaxID=97005 RepID=A0ABD2K6A1_HETSC